MARKFDVDVGVAGETKREQETNSLNRISDSFKKIVVVKDNIIPWYDEQEYSI